MRVHNASASEALADPELGQAARDTLPDVAWARQSSEGMAAVIAGLVSSRCRPDGAALARTTRGHGAPDYLGGAQRSKLRRGMNAEAWRRIGASFKRVAERGL